MISKQDIIYIRLHNINNINEKTDTYYLLDRMLITKFERVT